MRRTPIKAAKVVSSAAHPVMGSSRRFIVFIGFLVLLMTLIMLAEHRMLVHGQTRTLMVGDEAGYTKLLPWNENDDDNDNDEPQKVTREMLEQDAPHLLCQQEELVELNFLPRLPVRKTWESHTTATRHRPLNFVHIPKTGGSSIFVAAVKNGYAWADCLFPSKWSKRFCPKRPLRYPNGTGTAPVLSVDWPNHLYGAPWWHIPVQYLPQNTYRNFDLFAVVRNPYERAVSEYYYHCQLHKKACFGPTKGDDSVPRMNSKIQNFVQRQLTVPKNSSDYYAYWGHWIPQYDYFFNTTTKQQPTRIVAHLLHNEVLHEEFTSLLTAYGYNWTLPVHRHRSRQDMGAQLTAFNLTSNTMKWIEIAYEQDFVLGGYEMLSGRVMAMEQQQKSKSNQGKSNTLSRSMPVIDIATIADALEISTLHQ